jgi:hypothetical protein
VPSAALRLVVGGLNLLPLMCLKVVGVEVVKGNALVVDTTMATEQVDLVIQESCSGVGSWGWSATGGLLVLRGSNLFALASLPGEAVDC